MVDTLQELLRRLGLGLADFVIFVTSLRESPVWQGVFIDVMILAGETEVTGPHGLGRTHEGACVVFSTTAVPVFVRPASSATEITMFLDAALPYDVECRVWVFG